MGNGINTKFLTEYYNIKIMFLEEVYASGVH